MLLGWVEGALSFGGSLGVGGLAVTDGNYQLYVLGLIISSSPGREDDRACHEGYATRPGLICSESVSKAVEICLSPSFCLTTEPLPL